jgi:heat-inducible transcriptional repressor
MELTAREVTVLSCIAEQYISSGAPVASREIARRSGLGLSPASIRHVVAGLESRGLLTRRHASAGSEPTDNGFRIYVDSLRPRSLPAATRRLLEQRMTSMKRELVEDLEWIARVAADATQGAGMAMRPMGEEPGIEVISLLPLGSRRILGMVVTSDGAITKRVLERDPDLTSEALLEMSNLLTANLKGRSIQRVRRELADSTIVLEPERGAALRAVETARRLLADDNDVVELQVAGAENLLRSADFAEAHRVRSLLATLHDRQRVADEWRRALDHGPTQVIIGDESEVTASGNLGMVVTLFFRSGHRAGALGVVGPRRMDYGRIVPVVEFIGDTLTRMLEEPGATHA